MKSCFPEGNEIAGNRCKSSCCSSIRIYQPTKQVSNRTPKEILEYYRECKNTKLDKLLHELKKYNELEVEVIDTIITSVDNTEKWKDTISKLELCDAMD
jgi:hypothetical protein